LFLVFFVLGASATICFVGGGGCGGGGGGGGGGGDRRWSNFRRKVLETGCVFTVTQELKIHSIGT